MVKKLVSVAVVALAFAAGVAADRFLSPCRTSAAAAVKAEDEAELLYGQVKRQSNPKYNKKTTYNTTECGRVTSMLVTK